MRFEQFPLKDVGHTVLLAGAIFNGPAGVYLVPLPENGGFDRSDVLEVELGVDEWHQLLRQTDLMETEILQRAADGTLTKAIVRKCERQIAQQVSWNVFRRDDFRCRYCGRADAPLTVDHLVLWEEGGPSTLENLVAACRACNKARGRTPYADWLHSAYYYRVAASLSLTVRQANEALADTLASIPRWSKARSR